MNYEESIEKAIDFIDKVDTVGWAEDETIHDSVSGCHISCVKHFKSLSITNGSSEQLFLITILKTMQTCFYLRGKYFVFNEDGYDDWGYTFSSLCEVGAFFQPFYKDWLDKRGLALEPSESEEYPYSSDVIVPTSNS